MVTMTMLMKVMLGCSYIYMMQAREDILEAVENAVVAGEDVVEAM